MRALLLFVCMLLTACTVDQATAEEVLADEGYHNVVLEGYAPFQCSDDDSFASHFSARRTIINADGATEERTVHGTLCCGWFKDCTVRH